MLTIVASYEDSEVFHFLDMVVETNSLKKIDGKAISNIKIFDMLAAKVYENNGDEDEENVTNWETKN